MNRCSGQIERVVYFSEENGFCVLRVKNKEVSEPFSVVGTVPSVNEGEWLSAVGEWHMDAVHGKQFKATSIQLSSPHTLEGIEKYLASDLVKGIGKEYASRLVRAFGEEVFDVIEHNSARLLTIEGIGRLRKEAIKSAWDEQKNIRKIMAFLFSHGLSTTRAFRIQKKYGDQAIERIQQDPYRLARDISGIGFQQADEIAKKLGFDEDSPVRALAGLEYMLHEKALHGDTTCAKEELLTLTEELLSIERTILQKALSRALENKQLIRSVHTIESISLPLFYEAEYTLANQLIHLNKAAHPLEGLDINTAIHWAEEKSVISLADSQKEALKKVIGSKISLLTGGPGVGKTTLINTLLLIYRAKKLRIACCAPTGRAAKRMSESTGMESKTVHRLLQFQPGGRGFVHNKDHPLPVDVLIIDEASMLDAMLASALVQALPKHVIMIWVGDPDQLPSVGAGNVLHDLIESTHFRVARLKEVFRQAATSQIVQGAHAINEGRLPDFSSESAHQDLYYIEAEEDTRALSLILKMVTQSIPEKFNVDPFKDIQVLTPMQKGTLGAKNLNIALQQQLNATHEKVDRYGVSFRVGDRVMQTVNDYDKEVYNGDLGTIEKIDSVNGCVYIGFDNKRISYDFRELDALVHAYAITIHKSQGSEYPVVIIPVHTQHYVMLQRSLIYTALTRAKVCAIFIGTKKALRLAVGRALETQRNTLLKAHFEHIIAQD